MFRRTLILSTIAIATVLCGGCAVIPVSGGNDKVYFPMEATFDKGELVSIRPNAHAVEIVTTATLTASPYLIDRAASALSKHAQQE